MKVKNILLSLVVLGYIGANAADTTANTNNNLDSSANANKDKASTSSTSTGSANSNLSSQSIDQLIAKMQQVKAEERYKYMNAIKTKLSSINAKNRASKIALMQKHIENKKAQMQSKMEENAKNTHSRVHGMKDKSINTQEHLNAMSHSSNFGEMGGAAGMGGGSAGGIGGTDGMGGGADGMGGMGGMGGGAGGGAGGGSW